MLPIGGLKEKALAAQRADISRLIVPRRNEADIEDVPPHLRERMKFVLVDNVDEVLDAALERPRARGDARASRPDDGRRIVRGAAGRPEPGTVRPVASGS